MPHDETRAVAMVHERRTTLRAFADRWEAAVPAGLDPAPGVIARTALDREGAFRTAARSGFSTTEQEAEIVDELVAGTLTLEQAAEKVAELGRLRESAEIANRLLGSAGDRVLGQAIKELKRADLLDLRQAAFTAAVNQLEALAPKAAGITSDAEAVRAPRLAADAWRRASELAEHLELIRRAAPGFAESHDRRTPREYQRWRNPAARPDYRGNRPHGTRHLLDAVIAGAGRWLPTAAEASEAAAAAETAKLAAAI